MNLSFSRRSFLKGALAAGTGFARIGAEPYAGRIEHPGVILGFMDTYVKADPAGALETIASLGYRYLEYGGFYGMAPAEFMGHLNRLGLKSLAGGSSMQGLLDHWGKTIDEAHTAGRPYVVCYWPWLSSADHLTLDEIRQAADRLNDLGERCRKEGLKFAFHNHDKEFRPVEGQVPAELLLEGTDPGLVSMEIDLYWTVKGGADPVAYFKRYPGRFPLCHVKDMDATPERGFETPGKGILDFPVLFKHAVAAGVEFFIVERDNAPDPLATIRDAAAYLKQLRF